jgi:small subunit ribosomal protein S4
MGRQIGPQCKLCRREGTKLYLKGDRCNTPKCGITKRNYVPGLHGPRLGRARLTDYGKQLREKQKAKRLYNMFEKQFRNYFDSATRAADDTGQKFFELLEMRLDNLVYKSGFAESLRHARQTVGHGHFLVNGKKVNIPSYHVKVGDVISLREKSSQNKNFATLAERMKNKNVPDWLFFDSKEMSLKVIDIPLIEKFSLDFDMKSIIEFYSR